MLIYLLHWFLPLVELAASVCVLLSCQLSVAYLTYHLVGRFPAEGYFPEHSGDWETHHLMSHYELHDTNQQMRKLLLILCLCFKSWLQSGIAVPKIIGYIFAKGDNCGKNQFCLQCKNCYFVDKCLDKCYHCGHLSHHWVFRDLECEYFLQQTG